MIDVTSTDRLPAAVPAELERALEEHRRELTGFCYRMMGSTFEADDAVQETMVRAWRGYAGFEGRSSLRAWLYRIATNVCLDALQGRARRAVPMDLGPASSGDVRQEAGPPEVAWLQPVPDAAVLAPHGDPADTIAARESVRLAFVAALQHLPPRQRAVLILRDVLGWHASEVAELLETTPTSVHSALQRAHARLAARPPAPGAVPLDAEHAELLARYVDAFERYDVDALVALLHEDATMSMPPLALWMHGPDALRRWWQGPGAECSGSRLLATAANGAPAFGLYRPAPDGGHDAFGIHVVEIGEGRVIGIHTFIEPELFERFGLPDRLPGSPVGQPSAA
jgi:RNA polymerase sigma-70 factor, ECF subfamily